MPCWMVVTYSPVHPNTVWLDTKFKRKKEYFLNLHGKLKGEFWN